jgi:ABC-type cobalamin/Fe3+-siderophores transport system ATPase subunit
MLLMRDGELYAFGETYQVLSSKNIENVFEVSMSSIFYERHTFA